MYFDQFKCKTECCSTEQMPFTKTFQGCSCFCDCAHQQTSSMYYITKIIQNMSHPPEIKLKWVLSTFFKLKPLTYTAKFLEKNLSPKITELRRGPITTQEISPSASVTPKHAVDCIIGNDNLQPHQYHSTSESPSATTSATPEVDTALEWI